MTHHFPFSLRQKKRPKQKCAPEKTGAGIFILVLPAEAVARRNKTYVDVAPGVFSTPANIGNN
jgi:hypothetical protein